MHVISKGYSWNGQTVLPGIRTLCANCSNFQSWHQWVSQWDFLNLRSLEEEEGAGGPMEGYQAGPACMRSALYPLTGDLRLQTVARLHFGRHLMEVDALLPRGSWDSRTNVTTKVLLHQGCLFILPYDASSSKCQRY